jgi:NAD(P)-dependent dehydrogenase (short-subunit alcohol dehydrogenase family)
MTETLPTYFVVGATSGIARALCHRLAARGWRLVLAARNAEGLRRLADDLQVRYQRPFPTIAFDSTDVTQVRQLFDKSLAFAPTGLDGLIVCHGMTPRDAGGLDDDALQATFHINFLSVAMLLNAAAVYFEPRRAGRIAAISSVAGDRGRQSNFVYGAAKAALSTYLQGLRNRLQPRGVHVLTIKPGFVDTPMTQGMKLPAKFLVAKPERVAADIERALLRRCDVMYTPWLWRWIMAVVGMIPEAIFKRLKL